MGYMVYDLDESEIFRIEINPSVLICYYIRYCPECLEEIIPNHAYLFMNSSMVLEDAGFSIKSIIPPEIYLLCDPIPSSAERAIMGILLFNLEI